MEASWALLGATAYQYAKALILCSRGLWDFLRGPMHTELVAADPSSREVDRDTLERKVAT